MARIGSNQKSIREENLLQALKILVFQGPCSRRELAQKMGLSKMSITNLVSVFLKQGLVVEDKDEAGKLVTVGPRPVLLKLATGKFVAIGIHITEDRIIGQMVDLAVGLLYETSIVLEAITSKTQFMKLINTIITELMKYDCGYEIQLSAIGIIDEHYINRSEGSITFKGNSLGIDTEFITTSLQSLYDIPVFIENQRMGMLLTEMVSGNYDINKKYYFLNISEEISGGFANGLYIQKGCVGLSGQVGHMSIKYDGPKCKCGNRGCYEHYGSIQALLKHSNCTSVKEFNSNLNNREPQALQALESFIQTTAVAITNIINLYDPEVVVIVGDILQLDASVLKKIEYLVNNSFVFRQKRIIQLCPSTLNEVNYCKGAAILAIYRMIDRWHHME